ncbi:hypothetical protein M436DRAFT_65173 [Aureobasidium namibiae CBS 147.97]|uniref:Uncharacterized protein n=1 Tax=Aureobasidium namibiae CBS 147.97 TaxID=1043004 RepID=A0A074WPQ5_9PEZI|nr:uncharacterized protein M436DRAFT_65173 [Aureobasidium namibiae CBS 147.97]KEQ71687.1 hypothetical protein M436DRAFT_65173 [Aureobasidium namibiae CBS 147.97]
MSIDSVTSTANDLMEHSLPLRSKGSTDPSPDLELIRLTPPFDEADEALLQLKAGLRPLRQRYDEIKMIEAYRAALQPHEKKKQELTHPSTQLIDKLKDVMRAIAEDLDRERGIPRKSAYEHVGELLEFMSIAPKKRSATRAVTRSQTRTETQSVCNYESFKTQESKLTRIQDDICKSSMRCDDQLPERDQTVGKKMAKEKETAKWATEVATDFGEAKKLSAVAETSGIDLQVESVVILHAMIVMINSSRNISLRSTNGIEVLTTKHLMETNLPLRSKGSPGPGDDLTDLSYLYKPTIRHMGSLQRLSDKSQSLESQLEQLDMMDQYRTALEQHREKVRDLSQEHTRLGQERDQIRARLHREEEKMVALARYALQCLDTGVERPCEETNEQFSAFHDALIAYVSCIKSDEEYEHRVKEEAGSWDTVIATNSEGKALYEAAEASSRDLAAERASIWRLLREIEADYCELLDEEFGS